MTIILLSKRNNCVTITNKENNRNKIINNSNSTVQWLHIGENQLNIGYFRDRFPNVMPILRFYNIVIYLTIYRGFNSYSMFILAVHQLRSVEKATFVNNNYCKNSSI